MSAPVLRPWYVWLISAVVALVFLGAGTAKLSREPLLWLRRGELRR